MPELTVHERLVAAELELARLRRIQNAVEQALAGRPGHLYLDRTVRVFELHAAMNDAGRTSEDYARALQAAREAQGEATSGA